MVRTVDLLCVFHYVKSHTSDLLMGMNSIADNLPVATRLEFYPNRETGTDEEQKKDVVKDVQFEHGYRLGFTDNNKVSALTASVT